MTEILFNEKINDYTFSQIIESVKSIKKVPIKFKLDDSTSKFRKELLLNKIIV